jgi:CheY-like chemotaxis protein
MAKKIMVVDDESDILLTLGQTLEFSGYEVMKASNGKECLELLEKDEKPDLILLDIMMPEMSGWDVFTKIKEKPACKNIPIVFLTAKNDDYSVGFGKFSADDYITKPFEIQYLKEKIQKILER